MKGSIEERGEPQEVPVYRYLERVVAFATRNDSKLSGSGGTCRLNIRKDSPEDRALKPVSREILPAPNERQMNGATSMEKRRPGLGGV
jgi:hypothetical protein